MGPFESRRKAFSFPPLLPLLWADAVRNNDSARACMSRQADGALLEFVGVAPSSFASVFLSSFLRPSFVWASAYLLSRPVLRRYALCASAWYRVFGMVREAVGGLSARKANLDPCRRWGEKFPPRHFVLCLSSSLESVAGFFRMPTTFSLVGLLSTMAWEFIRSRGGRECFAFGLRGAHSCFSRK